MNKFQSETYINDPMDISDDENNRTNVSENEKIIEHFEEALFDLYEGECEGKHEAGHENESIEKFERTETNEIKPSYLETRRYLVAPRTSQQPINIQPINIYDVNDYKINPLNV